MNKITNEISELLVRLQTSEKDLQISNEELQSAVEELATMNEEFYALNEELESKNQQLEKLSLLAKNTHELVIITDINQKIEWVNSAFEKLTGYALHEVMGKTPNFLQGKDTSMGHKRKFREGIQSKLPFQQEILNYGKHGNVYWLLVSITPIFDNEGNLQKFIAVELDITSQKEQEKKLGDLNSQNTSLQQFSYIVSHNLRSSVANLMGLAELMTYETNVSAELQQYIQLFGKTAKGLDNTIADLNEILYIRSDIHKIYRQFVWAEVVEEIYEELKPMIASKQVVFQSFIEIENLTSVRSYCKSIVHNLLSNAIKYSSPNRQPHIILKISKAANTNYQQIEVQDNGIGIDLKMHEQNLFGMYKRFHTEQDGKGLGLYIVKNQVDILVGTISVESVVDKGSSFKVLLPC
jgi:PAS domain S-box-containing protein